MRWVKLQRAGRGSCAVGREDDEVVLRAAGDAVVARVLTVSVVLVVISLLGGVEERLRLRLKSFRWLALPKILALALALLLVMVWAQPGWRRAYYG